MARTWQVEEPTPEEQGETRTAVLSAEKEERSQKDLPEEPDRSAIRMSGIERSASDCWEAVSLESGLLVTMSAFPRKGSRGRPDQPERKIVCSPGISPSAQTANDL